MTDKTTDRTTAETMAEFDRRLARAEALLSQLAQTDEEHEARVTALESGQIANRAASRAWNR